MACTSSSAPGCTLPSRPPQSWSGESRGMVQGAVPHGVRRGLDWRPPSNRRASRTKLLVMRLKHVKETTE